MSETPTTPAAKPLDPDLASDFVDEANEKLRELDELLEHLKNKPTDQDLFSRTMRALHTIKGSCAFLGLSALERIVHHAESVLMRLKAGDLRITHNDVALIENTRNAVKNTLDGISTDNSKPRAESTVTSLWDAAKHITETLGQKLGKAVNIKTSGDATPIDSGASQTLKAPMMHIVRNAVDHGIEPVEQRRQIEKPDEGEIALTAYRDGDNIVIIISDDGQGLPLDAIKKKALDAGLATKDELDSMPDTEIYELIFKDGLSTSKDTTETSGRGAGLSAARADIEKKGGNLSVSSAKDKGTSFTIKLPSPIASEADSS